MTVQDQEHAKRLMIFQAQPETPKNSLLSFLSTELSWKMEAHKIFVIYENTSHNLTIDEKACSKCSNLEKNLNAKENAKQF